MSFSTSPSQVLSDILGSEDALGDMDFKVAGDDSGVTAFQMDIKVDITAVMAELIVCIPLVCFSRDGKGGVLEGEPGMRCVAAYRTTNMWQCVNWQRALFPIGFDIKFSIYNAG